ncbi:hypothetical protein, partial, partial [Parasitella parasitica]
MQLASRQDTINWEKARHVYRRLVSSNPHLAQFNNEQALERLSQIVSESDIHIKERNARNWSTSSYSEYVMPSENVAPSEGLSNFENMLLGVDLNNRQVLYKTPALFAIMFPYLYTSGQGYYSLVPGGSLDQKSEVEGGIAVATQWSLTLKQYVKERLVMPDRRFARDTAWIFMMPDIINRHDILSANRHVVSTQHASWNRESVLDRGQTGYDSAKTSLVPYQIRSSIAYKKRLSLDLYTIFRHYGPPHMFLTFTCDEFSPMYSDICEGLKPWEDPIIKGAFASMIGGLKAYSYVVEKQACGSPHVHIVLWSETLIAQQLLDKGFITAHIPRYEDNPEFNYLVRRLQTHQHRPYCSPLFKDVNTTSVKTCRFNYPREPLQASYIDENARAHFARTTGQEW